MAPRSTPDDPSAQVHETVPAGFSSSAPPRTAFSRATAFIKSDTTARFNHCEYLRVVPTATPRHRLLYGMRQDTASLNAQLERAFYGSRLPAWGVHNQTTIVLLAALADNAWARHVWYDEVQRQAHPPGAPAAT